MTERNSPPILFIIAGSNGAGKSTLYDQVLRHKIKVPFINADIIQKNELKDQSMPGAYAAAKIATQRRQERIAQKISFITETVFSHGSKNQLIEDAVRAGFVVTVFHIGLASSDMAVERVATRVRQGGHNVPVDKVRSRYLRGGPLISRAAHRADYAYVFDNSIIDKPPSLQIKFKNGIIVQTAPTIYEWCRALYDLK